MLRPAKLHSRQGLLLVEAVLSAIVIGVGLAWITRGLGTQLRAIRTVEDTDTLLALAQGKMVELESQRLFRPSPMLQKEGVFEEPYQAYRWMLKATERRGAQDLMSADHNTALTCDVTLTVERSASATPGGGHSGSVQLHAIWPSEGVLR